MRRDNLKTKTRPRPEPATSDRVADRFRTLMEHAFEAVALWDSDGTIRYVSPNSQLLLGYGPEEMVGRAAVEYVHPHDRERWWSLLTSLRRDPGRSFTTELRVRHADASWRWVEGTACNLLDDPSVEAIVINLHDVTERKRAETQLAVQYAVTAVLAESAPLAEASTKLLRAICGGVGWDVGELWHVDAASNVLRLDGVWYVPTLDAAPFAELEHTTTFARGDGVPGRAWESGEAVWIDDRVADHMVRAAAARELGLRSGFAMPIHSGAELTGVMLFLGRDVREPDEDVRHLLEALGRQISAFIERKRIEAEMFQLAAIVASSDDAILSVNLDGVITSWNSGAERTYGYAAAETLGRPSALLLPEARRDEIAQILMRIRRGELVDHYETVRVRKDGTHISVSLSVSPIKDLGGRIIGAASIARDITERERAAAHLREVQKLAQHRERLADIGAITAEVVHELGNPLAGISAQAQLILRRAGRVAGPVVDPLMQPAERILAEVSRLESLIRDFRSFARGQQLQLKAVDLARFLQETVDRWQPVIAERDINLAVDRPQTLPPLTADEEKLRRVLDNLVKNAIEAIGDRPGRVTICVRLPDDDSVHISVIDTGPGIAETVRGFRLFETTKPDGTGLGLAIAQNIIIAHRGRIEFARTPDGTQFRIELPRRGPLS